MHSLGSAFSYNYMHQVFMMNKRMKFVVMKVTIVLVYHVKIARRNLSFLIDWGVVRKNFILQICRVVDNYFSSTYIFTFLNRKFVSVWCCVLAEGRGWGK